MEGHAWNDRDHERCLDLMIGNQRRLVTAKSDRGQRGVERRSGTTDKPGAGV